VNPDRSLVPAFAVGWLHVPGADQPDRDDRRAGPQRDPRDTGAELVQPPVRRTGALRVDAEGTAVLEQVDAYFYRRRGGPDVAAFDRDLTHAAEEGRHSASAQPGRVEVLRFGEIEHLAPRGQRGEELVRERNVVAGDDDRPGARNELESDDLRPVKHT
jgi:hypothetical protein